MFIYTYVDVYKHTYRVYSSKFSCYFFSHGVENYSLYTLHFQFLHKKLYIAIPIYIYYRILHFWEHDSV